MNKQRLSLAAALVAVACSVLPARALPAPGSLDGLWDAVVAAAGTEVPFRFEIASKGAEVEGFFFEGDRKVGSSSGKLEDGLLSLDYDHLNTTLEVKVNFARAITRDTGRMLCEGTIVHRGRTIATAEARLVAEASGRLHAHGTATCLLMAADGRAA